MKKLLKILRNTLLCIFTIFFLVCSLAFFSGVHISGDGMIFKIGKISVSLAVVAAFIYISLALNELRKCKFEEKTNFILKFPRKLSPSWTTFDSVLADLVYDYGLDDDEVEEIARSGVHDAVSQYRKAHPLDHTPSEDLFVTVFPYE